MKTILRVIRTGDQKIRFETDLDVKKNPEEIPELVNRKEMIRKLDETSRMIAQALEEARLAVERSCGTVVMFPPGVQPSGHKN